MKKFSNFYEFVTYCLSSISSIESQLETIEEGGGGGTDPEPGGSLIVPMSQAKLFSNSWYEQKSGYVHTSALSSTEDITTATSVTISHYFSPSAETTGEIAIYVNDSLYTILTISTTGISTTTHALPAGNKMVRYVTGSQQRTNDSGDVKGTYIISKTYNQIAVPIDNIKKSKVKFIEGDSISVGIATTNPVTDSVVSKLRLRSELTDCDIIADGWGYKGLIPSFGANYATEATRIVNAVSGYSDKEVIFILSTNDYGLNYGTPTQAATALTNLINAIAALDNTIKFKVITPYHRTGENSNNGVGFNLPAYRSALSAITTLNTTFLDGTSIDFSAYTGDGVHPTTAGVTTIVIPAIIDFIADPPSDGWINISSANFTDSNVSWSGNTATATGSGNSFSTYKVASGASAKVRAKINTAGAFNATGTLAVDAGFTSEGNYTGLDYGIYAYDNALAYIETGTPTNTVTAIATNDIVELDITATQVIYKLNGTTVHTASRGSVDLYLKLWFIYSGATITNIQHQGLTT